MTMSEAHSEQEHQIAKPYKQTYVGIVTSDRMNKSRVVQVERYALHQKYKKFLRLKKKYMVHDEKNETKLNDRVEITECRPMSRRKCWRITKVLKV